MLRAKKRARHRMGDAADDGADQRQVTAGTNERL